MGKKEGQKSRGTIPLSSLFGTVGNRGSEPILWQSSPLLINCCHVRVRILGKSSYTY